MGENRENSIVIERVFDAPLEKVWQAWTDPEMIKKWWGPEGFTAPSIKVDLRIGGKYVYAMRGPADSQWDKVMYSAGVYQEIVPNEKIVTTDYLSDEHGNRVSPSEYGMSNDLPNDHTATVKFEDAGEGKTKLSIIYAAPETEEQYQAMLKSGMTEGWKSALGKLARSLN
ncbi:MAG TPA: SRPBCC domain-containing protein [Candidatus Saccharimonadales bacterium]